MSILRSCSGTSFRLAAALLGGLLFAPSQIHAVEYPTRTKGNTKVRIYEQRLMPETNGGTLGGPGHVIAKYSDLIQKAIAYKQAHSNETVEIRFTTYRMSRDIYIGYDPSRASYLRVSGNYTFDADYTEKLIWSFCKAAQAGVSVKMIIHKAGESAVSLATIAAYLDANGGSNLSYKMVGWGDGSDDQMHNKFLLINKTRSGSSDYHSIVYTTSANVDDWADYGPIAGKNWAQTGVLLYKESSVSGTGAYEAYRKYFDDALWPHATDTSAAAFRSTMASLHSALGGLNYPEDADGISAYFYPVPDANYWSTTYNPHAKVFDIINNNPNVSAPFVKMNQAFLRFHNTAWTEFGVKFMQEVNTMASTHGINLASTTVANVRCVAMDHDDDGNDFSPISSNRLALVGRRTHSKNLTYAFDLSGTTNYYSTGGSTNGKYNDFTRKANNIVMVKETVREVYDDFYDIFNYAFDNP